jgi:BASS family bile acid:Na+ symporter
MVLLAGSSAVVAPLLLRVLLPLTSGDVQVQIDAGQLIGTLLVAQFLPLCVGLALRQWCPALAAKLKKPAGLLSMALNLALLAIIFTVQFSMLVGIPVRAYVGMTALVLAGVAAGWLLGGPGADTRTAMVMATAVRNVGVSLVIATGSFPGTPAVTATTAFALFQTLLMALIALGWRLLVPTKADGTKVPLSVNEVETRGAAL